MRIDVYDFDGTIYDGDSTVDFWLYCLRRKPALLRFLPLQAGAGVMMAAKAWSFTRGKGAFLRFVTAVDAAALARDFWSDKRTLQKVGAWFGTRPRDLPFIIASASPQFMLEPIAGQLGAAHLVATRVDLKTGRLEGENCRAAEKISRLHGLLGDFSVRAMYTDNPKADGPLLALADERYLVTHGRFERLGEA